MKNHRSCVLSMALLDDQLLCSGAKNGVILVTDIVSGGVLQTYRGHSGPVTAVAMKWLERLETLHYNGQEATCCVLL